MAYFTWQEFRRFESSKPCTSNPFSSCKVNTCWVANQIPPRPLDPVLLLRIGSQQAVAIDQCLHHHCIILPAQRLLSKGRPMCFEKAKTEKSNTETQAYSVTLGSTLGAWEVKNIETLEIKQISSQMESAEELLNAKNTICKHSFPSSSFSLYLADSSSLLTRSTSLLLSC